MMMTDIFIDMFDVFNLFNLIFIISVVGALIFLIIVIVVVYKLLHSNVNNRSKKTKEINIGSYDNPYRKKETPDQPKLERCPYCGEKTEPDIVYCPSCGAELKN